MAEPREHDDAAAPVWSRFEGVAMSTGLAIRRHYDTRLAGLGISLPEAMVLALVAERGPLNQATIARSLDSGRVTTSLRIDGLAARGLLERATDPDDRRAWRIAATPAGRELVGRIDEIDREVRTALRRGTSREQRRTFAEVARQVRANIDAAPSPGSSEPSSTPPVGHRHRDR